VTVCCFVTLGWVGLICKQGTVSRVIEVGSVAGISHPTKGAPLECERLSEPRYSHVATCLPARAASSGIPVYPRQLPKFSITYSGIPNIPRVVLTGIRAADNSSTVPRSRPASPRGIDSSGRDRPRLTSDTRIRFAPQRAN
jgi:hypothetical protein